MYFKIKAHHRKVSVSRSVPPVGVGGSSVLHDVVRAERHDGSHGALEAFLRLDEHRVTHLAEVLRGDGAAHLKGSPAHGGFADVFGDDVQSGT